MLAYVFASILEVFTTISKGLLEVGKIELHTLVIIVVLSVIIIIYIVTHISNPCFPLQYSHIRQPGLL